MKLFSKSTILSMVVTLSLCSPGWAAENLSIRGMLNEYDQGNASLKKYYVDYIGNQALGFLFANSALHQQKRRLLYCQPNIAFSNIQYFMLFREYVQTLKFPLERPSGFSGTYLLMALMETFPCR
jgi:hypothetical protein